MSPFLRLISHLKNYKPLLVGNLACNLLMVIFSVVSIPAIIPFLNILLDQQPMVTSAPDSVTMGNFKEHVNYFLSQIIAKNGKRTALAYALGLVLVLYFLKNIFRYLSQFFLSPVRNGVVRDIRQGLYNKMLALPLAYFSEERKGDLLARMSVDVQEVEASILNVLESIIREPLMIIGAFGFMVYVSPSMTLAVLGLLAFTGFVIGRIGKVLKRQSREVQERLGTLISMMEEGIGGLRIIKGFNAEAFRSAHFRRENNEYRRLLVRLLWRRDLSSPLTEFLGVATVAVLIWYGYSEVEKGLLTVPTFFALLLAFFSMIEPAKKFANAFYNVQKGMAAMERIDAIEAADLRVLEKPDARRIQVFEDRIELRNVGFAYANSNRAALEDINLTISKGKIVALVGPSGAGKSTLADLLPRFYDTTSGEILLDGQDIQDYRVHDLRSLMGIVTQEPVLFNDTIFNNIAFGMTGVTAEAVEQAARIAHAHDFILETPEGYQTNIGDRGVKLSGGQRQRLTIARAVLANPPILILDEATSALDSESERLVQDALDVLMKNRTSIVIAHRLSTVQHADEIVVMKDGKIIEQGTHEALMQQGGEYGKLVELQSF
ncbi:MAG: ABC transporter ATP-binding protein/permease [Saprospiraceae bacterium]|nr:ABC transporter ATP-binding protein/permease [Saprospiraceae bacterium]MCF8252799.1 ABC transporter ATP-binding protein/permease [Saprospiraceae bacterium]MCF8283222.1 ABC transporter ATP-binding protein/permease [Bacteroidales bacterium]MCF8314354.1 ABC transporter ATP-binding protein/permease [Saprospiraceae bacterium]MCF8443223.1 ABC transporter ATP-binding protein/permease [Saprospiraceae bacterium]